MWMQMYVTSSDVSGENKTILLVYKEYKNNLYITTAIKWCDVKVSAFYFILRKQSNLVHRINSSHGEI